MTKNIFQRCLINLSSENIVIVFITNIFHERKKWKFWGENGTNNTINFHQIRSDQLLSRVRLFVTPWIAARQASLSTTNSWSSLRLMSIKSVMPSSHLILCRPLLLLPPIPPSERLLLNHTNTPGFLAPGEEEFNPGPETRLDRSELLCNKVLLKYKGDRESFWQGHQKGAERVPAC